MYMRCGKGRVQTQDLGDKCGYTLERFPLLSNFKLIQILILQLISMYGYDERIVKDKSEYVWI